MLSVFANETLFGERSGDTSVAPTVLALHGWGGSHQKMTTCVRDLPAICLDLPGFGASPAPRAVWGAKEYADAVAKVMTEMNTPAVVVGHSFGGRVGVELAANYPQLVKSIVLVGVPLLRNTPARKGSMKFRALKKLNNIGLVSDERMNAIRQRNGSPDYKAASGIMRDIFVKVVNEEYQDAMSLVQCSVELVWGENDTEARLSVAQRAIPMFKRTKATLTVVPGGDHWLPTNNPTPVSEAILRSLQ